MLDLTLFESRPFWTATPAPGSITSVFTPLSSLMPFYLLQGRGFSLPGRPAAHLPSLVRAAASPLFGALSDRIGTRQPSVLGMGILGAGLYLLSRLEKASQGSARLCRAIGRRPGRRHVRVSQHQRPHGRSARHQQGVAAGVMATARTSAWFWGWLGWGAVDHDCGSQPKSECGQERCFVPSMADFLWQWVSPPWVL